MRSPSDLRICNQLTYISENPQIVVSGFRHAGISAALDDCCESDQEDEKEADVLSDEANMTLMMKLTISSDDDSD